MTFMYAIKPYVAYDEMKTTGKSGCKSILGNFSALFQALDGLLCQIVEMG